MFPLLYLLHDINHYNFFSKWVVLEGNGNFLIFPGNFQSAPIVFWGIDLMDNDVLSAVTSATGMLNERRQRLQILAKDPGCCIDLLHNKTSLCMRSVVHCFEVMSLPLYIMHLITGSSRISKNKSKHSERDKEGGQGTDNSLIKFILERKSKVVCLWLVVQFNVQIVKLPYRPSKIGCIDSVNAA
jgi:hypothetical protein